MLALRALASPFSQPPPSLSLRYLHPLVEFMLRRSYVSCETVGFGKGLEKEIEYPVDAILLMYLIL